MAASLLFFLSPSPSSSSSLVQGAKSSTLFAPSPISAAPLRIPHAVSFRRPFPSIRAAAQVIEDRRGVSGDALDISKLGISEHIVSALSRRGITELFPIQRAVLEPAMEGRDMIGRAITGSGKTLAFGIPILDNIIRNRGHQREKRPSAIVLAPTRELARQVQREFKVSAPTLRSACLYGGIPIMSQVRDLKFGMDIVVGTPGRIIDLVERGALDLSEVKFVVLDEADQMLAIGFQEDVECILSHLPARKQCMLFSATMPSWVNDISRKHLNNPLVIDLVGDGDQKLAEGISLYSVASSNTNKHNLLPSLISRFAQGGKSIIFTKTKKDAETLSNSMRSVIGSRALHGNMQQFQRDKTLAGFRDGRFSVLVATDVAARGLDIPNVDLVVHFEMPNTSEIFIHRSGRTGRAGKEGTAVLLFTRNQRREVKSIERDLGVKFEELNEITGSDGEDFLYEDAVGDKFGRNFPRSQNHDNIVYETNRQFRNRDNSRKHYSSNNPGVTKFSDGEVFPYEDAVGQKFGHNFSRRQNVDHRFRETNRQYKSRDNSRKHYSSNNSGFTQVVREEFPYEDAVGHKFGHPHHDNVDHRFGETNRHTRGRDNSKKQYYSENSGSRHRFNERNKDPKTSQWPMRHHGLSFQNEADPDVFEPLNMNRKKAGRGGTSFDFWK